MSLRLLQITTPFIFGAALGLTACGESSSTEQPASEPEAGANPFAGGKAVLVDLATPLAYGQTVEGNVADRQLALFVMTADARDRFAVEVERTGGEYDPRTELLTISGTSVPHDRGSFSRPTETSNRKIFTMGESAGRHFVSVRANEWTGGGAFKLTLTCVDGPCAGVPVPEAGEVIEASICIGKARLCAFDGLEASAGLDRAAAQARFDDCLGQVELLTHPCDPNACAVDEDAGKVCGQIVDALVYYSAKPVACAQTLTDCMDTCTEQEENSPWLDDDDISFAYTGEAVCWLDHNWNGTCDEYARATPTCEGEGPILGGVDDCMAECGATTGAWGADVDELCGPHCQEICFEIEDDCVGRCAGDEACLATCAEDDERYGDVCDW